MAEVMHIVGIKVKFDMIINELAGFGQKFGQYKWT